MAVYTKVDDTALSRYLAVYDIGEVLSFAGIAEGGKFQLFTTDNQSAFHLNAL